MTAQSKAERAGPEGSEDEGVYPVVERPRSGLSTPALIGIAGVAAIGLFLMLDAHRRSLSAPATAISQRDLGVSAPVSPLYIPPIPSPTPTLALTATPPVSAPPPPPAVIAAAPPPAAVTYGPSPPPPPAPVRSAGGATLVIDHSAGKPDSAGAPLSASGGDKVGGADSAKRSGDTVRVRASSFANKSTTVPQGTIIPAVLETGFDSTQPGFARALVQRDIRGFDGTTILIPRGSRLIGEYASDTARGQNRAMIIWTRLIRPDGITIAIGSPASDPVGRGGIKAKVNSHFFERFGSAILQSSLDVGVNLASRASGSPVVVALPGSVQRVSGSVSSPDAIKPTLKVAAGTSVSVFVARDLDFTGADTAP